MTPLDRDDTFAKCMVRPRCTALFFVWVHPALTAHWRHPPRTQIDIA
jgi:hypothetical protein